MKRLLTITSAVLLSSALFFVAICAGGDPITKPSKASWSGTLYTVGVCLDAWPPTGNLGLVINVGKGVSSITGESDFVFVYCIDAATQVGSGWGIITTAAGDRLHVRIDEVSADHTKDPVEWSETETIVGGTGRFEGATGSAMSHGIWTSPTDPFPGASIPPQLLEAPQGWVGTSVGEMTF